MGLKGRCKNAFDVGTNGVAQRRYGCHVLSDTPSGYAVSDIPEGRSVFLLSGMSALQYMHRKGIYGVL